MVEGISNSLLPCIDFARSALEHQLLIHTRLSAQDGLLLYLDLSTHLARADAIELGRPFLHFRKASQVRVTPVYTRTDKLTFAARLHKTHAPRTVKSTL